MVRSSKDVESQALSSRIQALRENDGAKERECARRRQAADIEAFRNFIAKAHKADAGSPVARVPGSFKMVCALIRQRAQEDPSFVAPDHRKTLGFHYRMVNAPAYWIAVAERLAAHVQSGITREITALGPFVGLRVSSRSISSEKAFRTLTS